MALTLPSSNGNSLFNARSESIQVNTNFNGGLTQTTSTLTPTRLKNIQDAFLEQHSLLPPKPYLHEHMAGFVPPTVNVSLHVKHTSQFQSTPSKGAFNQLAVEAHNQKSSHDYNSANSNSNDSYSDDYSSETNSSTADTSHYSFNHFLPSSVTKARSKSSVTMNTRARASTRKSKSSSDKSDASTSSQPKKSTGGGRKPNNTEKLTPEEELKRAKRRERNKLAAARCRKRRVDQTNLLVGETTKLEKEHQSLVEQLNRQLAKLSQYKEAIDSHETHYCKRKHRLPSNIFAAIDYQAIQTAMEPIPEDDFDGELDDDKSVASGDHSIVDYSHNFGDDLGEEEEEFAEIVPPKRKRPNSLPLSKDSIYGEAGIHLRPNVFMTTPSNGLYLDCFESTGLTPLVPTVTATELTPSTMAALIKTLASPDDS